MTPSKLSSILPSAPDAQALEAELPYCDGRPMSDSELQFNVCAYEIVQPTRRQSSGRAIDIASNMAVYYRRPVEGADFDLARALDEENENPVVLAPDVFAVRGVSKRVRKSYQVEAEGRGPELVIEVASASTVARDLGIKREIYEKYGVLEYMLYDPTEEGLLSPRLQYFERVKDRFVRAEADERGRYFSAVLELEFGVAEDGLRFYERGSETPILRSDEAREAEKAAKDEALLRERAEREAKEAERQAKEEALLREGAEREAKEAALLRESAEREAKEAALLRESAEREAKDAAIKELDALRERLARLESESRDD